MTLVGSAARAAVALSMPAPSHAAVDLRSGAPVVAVAVLDPRLPVPPSVRRREGRPEGAPEKETAARGQALRRCRQAAEAPP
jgi:hypothetical protein